VIGVRETRYHNKDTFDAGFLFLVAEEKEEEGPKEGLRREEELKLLELLSERLPYNTTA
jgi:hypothetical protein